MYIDPQLLPCSIWQEALVEVGEMAQERHRENRTGNWFSLWFPKQAKRKKEKY